MAAYAAEIRRLAGIVSIEIAVAQDYMCEAFILARTGLDIPTHQALTIERYDALLAEDLPIPIMPVLQGYAPSDYLAHLAAYGERLTPGMRVGVGSVCKRNSDPQEVFMVLNAIAARRPDLRLHGFGLKKTALANQGVRGLLFSADSMAWSYNARRNGLNRNAVGPALAYAAAVERDLARPWQLPLPLS